MPRLIAFVMLCSVDITGKVLFSEGNRGVDFGTGGVERRRRRRWKKRRRGSTEASFLEQLSICEEVNR